jgi:hypothetical protein
MKLFVAIILSILLSSQAYALGTGSASAMGSAEQPSTIVGLWRGAAIANGATVSTNRYNLNLGLVQSFRANGTWSAKSDILVLAAENAPSALTSWKRRLLATAVAAPAFTVDRGYVFDGSTQYIDSNFNILASANRPISSRVGVYERTNVASARYSLGVGSASGSALAIMPRNALTGVQGQTNGAIVTFPEVVLTSEGFTTVSRCAATLTTQGFKNGSTAFTPQTYTGSTSFPSLNMWIGGRNIAGALNLPRALSTPYVEWGACNTSGQELTDYTVIQTYLTTIGAAIP